MAQITIAGLPVSSPDDNIETLSILLWGEAGTGKSTIAATMPGDILWLQYDSTGLANINSTVVNAGKEANIHVLRLAGMPNSFVERFKEEDPLTLSRTFKENPNIKSLVFDSLTSFADKALAYGVVKAGASVKFKNNPQSRPTIEDPGMAGYGNKRVYVEACIRNVMSICVRHGVNVCFITHEGPPEYNTDGQIVKRTLALGSSLNISVPRDLSEIWYLRDTGKERHLLIRSQGIIRPMRSNLLFHTEQKQSFKLNFNADDWSGEGIADWIEQWKANRYKKLEVPK